MTNLTLLAIDDDPLVLEAIKMINPEAWNIRTILSEDEIPDISFHAAMVDMHLTDAPEDFQGLEILKKLRQKHPHSELIAMSGDLRQEVMESTLKAGATRFIAKPLHKEEVLSVLEKIEASIALERARRSRTDGIKWVGSSEPAKQVRKEIAQLKGEAGPILIEGESGTGKEVISQLLNAQESDRVFIRVNVSAIPENLFESELFGHVKGAFTGANITKVGLLEAANGGDLFLDEIEALPETLQPKLLRFLDSGEVRKVGSNEIYSVNTRVIAATNENLSEMVQKGKFREDLLWRLSGKKINIPPLRERKEDIAEMCEHFLNMSHKRRLHMSPEAIETLKEHQWPGNVRELKRVVEQLELQAPMPILRTEDVEEVLKPKASVGSAFGRIQVEKGLAALQSEFERSILQQASEQFSDSEKAARTLGISRSSYYQKLKDHGLGSKNN